MYIFMNLWISTVKVCVICVKVFYNFFKIRALRAEDIGSGLKKNKTSQHQ